MNAASSKLMGDILLNAASSRRYSVMNATSSRLVGDILS